MASLWRVYTRIFATGTCPMRSSIPVTRCYKLPGEGSRRTAETYLKIEQFADWQSQRSALRLHRVHAYNGPRSKSVCGTSEPC